MPTAGKLTCADIDFISRKHKNFVYMSFIMIYECSDNIICYNDKAYFRLSLVNYSSIEFTYNHDQQIKSYSTF